MSEQRLEEGVQYIHKSNFKDALRKCSLLRLYWLSLVSLKISDESDRIFATSSAAAFGDPIVVP